MLATPKRHFDEDLVRARGLINHAMTIQEGDLQGDILRAGWMMGVGACDAYFSDAYGDLLARTLRAKGLERGVAIPDRLNNLKVPVMAVLNDTHEGWRWRMAARELIEDENVLSLDKIRKLFNHFFRPGHKIVNQETIETWILHPDAKSGLFGITATDYRRLSRPDQSAAKKAALEHFEEYFEAVFQRRHDCIHNCDRPKIAIQYIAAQTVNKKVHDIEFLVSRCHEAFLDEFPKYLQGLGFGAVTRNQVCQ